jgi:hypothetical protein
VHRGCLGPSAELPPCDAFDGQIGRPRVGDQKTLQEKCFDRKSVAAVWLFSPLPQPNIKTDNTVLVAHSADRYAASNVVLGLNDLL